MFIKVLLALFIIEAQAKEITIEITSGNSKIAIFCLQSDEYSKTLAEKIIKNLNLTKRFKSINSTKNLSSLKTMGVDILIKIQKSENNSVKVTVFDVARNKQMLTFITNENASKANIEICNKIYSAWLSEDGIFDTSLIYSVETRANMFLIKKKEYTSSSESIISTPISYLGNLVYANGRIFFTKFNTKTKGFAIFSYSKKLRKFFLSISIKDGAVFSPAIYNDYLFFSAASKGTTGIYGVPGANETNQFSSFKKFEQHPNTLTIDKIKDKIATSVNVTENLCIYTSDKGGKNTIFKHPNKPITKNASYFDPTLFKNQKIAAVKVKDKMFHLVTIDLKTNEEKVLISRYFIGKPSWSPCGNWIAIPCRNRNEQDVAILIHKSGKYTQTIQSKNSIKSIVWINSNEI